MAGLVLRDLVKTFGETEVLHGIDLEVADGEFVVFVGPSGCGKSTTLRMIAGLEEVTSGAIEIGGRGGEQPRAQGAGHRDGVPELRDLPAHVACARTSASGCDSSKLPKADKDARIDEVAEILGMTELSRPQARRSFRAGSGSASPSAARWCATRRCSSSTSRSRNLDAQLRTQMRLEIKKLHQRVGTTIVFVTHDQVEAMTMADRIVIMKDGAHPAGRHAGRGLSQARQHLRRAVHRRALDEPARRGVVRRARAVEPRQRDRAA